MYYIATIRVHQRMLSTVTGVFDEDRKSGDVVLLSIKPEETEPPAESGGNGGNKHHYRNGMRDKGISGLALFLSAIPTPGSVVTIDDLRRLFKDSNFESRGIHAYASNLRDSGDIEFLGTPRNRSYRRLARS